MRQSQFHRRSLASSMASTDGILASSVISLPVIFDSILEPAELKFLPTFSVNFHDSQQYRRGDTTYEPKRRSRRLFSSFVWVSALFRSQNRDQAFMRAWVRISSVSLRESQNIVSQVLADAHRNVRETAAVPCCDAALSGEC